MRRRRSFRPGVRLLALLGACVLSPLPGRAAAPGPDPSDLTVDVDEGEVIRLARSASHVFIANPDIADIQAPQQRTVLVQGKKAGRTTLIALDEKGDEIARVRITVVTGLGMLRDRLSHDYPEFAVSVDSTPTSIIVSGKVDTPEQAHGVVELVKAYAADPSKVVDRLGVNAQVQVQLRVHVAEMSRQVVNDFGLNWQAVFKNGSDIAGLVTGRSALNSTFVTNGTSNLITRNTNSSGNTDNTLVGGIGNGIYGVNAVLDFLGQEGLATILAEPNLTAISGQTASFLAGGEVPVVTQSGLNGTTVTYKEYGVRLNFTPTVLSHDRISLAVRPEVSQLTSVGSVTASGITIPALSTRRVDTTVELGSGDCLAIGGLLEDTRNNDDSRVPGLGDLPVLGKLFQSENFQNNESELVVFVTPYIVEPTKPTAMSASEHPAHAETETERLMTGEPPGSAAAQPPAELYGHAGLVF